MKSMGCGLLAPLTREVVKKERSPDHCQAALTHLTKVSKESSISRDTICVILVK